MLLLIRWNSTPAANHFQFSRLAGPIFEQHVFSRIQQVPKVSTEPPDGDACYDAMWPDLQEHVLAARGENKWRRTRATRSWLLAVRMFENKREANSLAAPTYPYRGLTCPWSPLWVKTPSTLWLGHAWAKIVIRFVMSSSLFWKWSSRAEQDGWAKLEQRISSSVY